MKKKITVIEGDGIGPEVTRQSIRVLNAIGQQYGHEFTYDYRSEEHTSELQSH